MVIDSPVLRTTHLNACHSNVYARRDLLVRYARKVAKASLLSRTNIMVRADPRNAHDEKAARTGGLDASIAVRCGTGPAKPRIVAYFCCSFVVMKTSVNF